MLYPSTLSEIANNTNTGVEYEIALFYLLLKKHPEQQRQVLITLNKRPDAYKINTIIADNSIVTIENALKRNGLQLLDCSFETQNDEVGPADIVMYLRDSLNRDFKLGLSVKYNNTCTLNVTGKNFITDQQISRLKRLLPQYTRMYIEEMTSEYGAVGNWFRQRKPSKVTDQYIDLIRDAVIVNWPNVQNKGSLLSALFHKDSPIYFWVVTFGDNGYTLQNPKTIDISRANDVTAEKFLTSYVSFNLDGRMIGRMQVKFNNGFVEKCKKLHPDIKCQGVDMSYGSPFSSWNFSVEK